MTERGKVIGTAYDLVYQFNETSAPLLYAVVWVNKDKMFITIDNGKPHSLKLQTFTFSMKEIKNIKTFLNLE